MREEAALLVNTHLSDLRTDSLKTSWGWLEPSSVRLPYVCLRNLGVAIGRGKEAFEERIEQTDSSATALSNHLFPGRHRERNLYKDLEFVEVADGRVSRIHCVITQEANGSTMESYVKDCSSNGTYLNDEIIKRGNAVRLCDKDKISLVRSVAPMTEHYFIFHKGSPQQKDDSRFTLRNEVSRPEQSFARMLARSLTSTYATPEKSTLADFECQICLRLLSSCVTIEPCGHNFCASCLSQYISSQLENGAQLVCPIRCPDPERIVKNETVRQLIAEKSQEVMSENRGSSEEELQSIVETELSTFTSTCPLFDEQLPLEIKSLKDRQVDLAITRLSGETNDAKTKNEALESLVRLCWSDDGARKIVLNSSGVNAIKETMESYTDDEGIQCNSCLALMSLVRGEDEVCRTSQWEIARSGCIEVIGQAMRNFEKQHIVQLSAMLCFIPLALESPMMQAHLAEEVLPDVLHALDIHPDDADLQSKGMIIIGILAQGEDALHDAIRIRQVELGAINRITNALKRFGSDNEEVFWGTLFALATLTRDKHPHCHHICRSLISCGMLNLLKTVLDSYQSTMSSLNEDPDDTIVSAAKYLIATIEDVENHIRREWQLMILSGLSISLLIGSVLAFVVFKRR